MTVVLLFSTQRVTVVDCFAKKTSDGRCFSNKKVMVEVLFPNKRSDGCGCCLQQEE